MKDVNKEVDSAYHKTKRISSFWYWVKDSVKKYVKSGKEEKGKFESSNKEEIKKENMKYEIKVNKDIEEQGAIDEIVEQMRRVKYQQKNIGE